MTTLYIAEYSTLGQIPNGGGQIAMEPPIAEQTIAIGGTSVQCTNPFNAKTRYVRLNTDSACSILFGTAASNPVATTSNQRLSPNQTEYKGVPEGGGYKVAVIMNT